MYKYARMYMYMRDEKEERKKQARSNKQTRQSNTAHVYACTDTHECTYMYMCTWKSWQATKKSMTHHPSFQGWASRCLLLHVYNMCLSGLWLGGLLYLSFFCFLKATFVL